MGIRPGKQRSRDRGKSDPRAGHGGQPVASAGVPRAKEGGAAPAGQAPGAPRFQSTAAQGDKATTALGIRIEQRGRRWHIVPVTQFFGLGGKPIAFIGVLYGHHKDTEASGLLAHKYVAEKAKAHDAPGAVDDDALLSLAKKRELLYRLLRAVDPNDPTKLLMTKDGQHSYPAFPSPNWMRENVSDDQLETLMNLVAEVRRFEAPRPEWLQVGEPAFGLDDLTVATWARELGGDGAGRLPSTKLASYPREFVTALAVRLCEQLFEAHRARDALLALLPPSEDI